MYPKVKVRQQAEPEQGEDERSSLSLENRSLPDKEYSSRSPLSIARVPKSYVPAFTTPSFSVPKEKNNTEFEDSKSNVKASPVPRPRAVLSSPDNDGMIGNINQTSGKKHSIMKKSNLGDNKDFQGKVNTRSLGEKDPVNTRIQSKETTNSKSCLKGKKSPEVIVPKQSEHLRKGRQRSTAIPSSTILSHSGLNI